MDAHRHSLRLAKRSHRHRPAGRQGAGNRRPRRYAQSDCLRLRTVRPGNGFVVANGRVEWRPHQPYGNLAPQRRRVGCWRPDRRNSLHGKGGSVRQRCKELECHGRVVILPRGPPGSLARQWQSARGRRIQRVLRFCQQLGAVRSGGRNLATYRGPEHPAPERDGDFVAKRESPGCGRLWQHLPFQRRAVRSGHGQLDVHRFDA